MKEVKRAYQAVFIMNDGVELPWKIFATEESVKAYIGRIDFELVSIVGIVSIGYRTRFIE